MCPECEDQKEGEDQRCSGVGTATIETGSNNADMVVNPGIFMPVVLWDYSDRCRCQDQSRCLQSVVRQNYDDANGEKRLRVGWVVSLPKVFSTNSGTNNVEAVEKRHSRGEKDAKQRRFPFSHFTKRYPILTRNKGCVAEAPMETLIFKDCLLGACMLRHDVGLPGCDAWLEGGKDVHEYGQTDLTHNLHSLCRQRCDWTNLFRKCSDV